MLCFLVLFTFSFLQSYFARNPTSFFMLFQVTFILFRSLDRQESCWRIVFSVSPSLFYLEKKTTTTRGIYPAKANSRGEITSWLNISTAKVGEFCPKGIDISNHPLWINNWARVHLSVMKQPRKNSDFIFANQQNKLENMASITQRFKLCISISVTIFPLSSQKLPNSISSLRYLI